MNDIETNPLTASTTATVAELEVRDATEHELEVVELDRVPLTDVNFGF